MQSIFARVGRRACKTAPRSPDIAACDAGGLARNELRQGRKRTSRIKIALLGVIPIDWPPVAEIAAYIDREITRWSGVVEQAGIAGTQ